MAGGYLAIACALSAASGNQVVAFVLSVAVGFLFTAAGLPIVASSRREHGRSGPCRRHRRVLAADTLRGGATRRAGGARAGLLSRLHRALAHAERHLGWRKEGRMMRRGPFALGRQPACRDHFRGAQSRRLEMAGAGAPRFHRQPTLHALLVRPHRHPAAGRAGRSRTCPFARGGGELPGDPGPRRPRAGTAGRNRRALQRQDPHPRNRSCAVLG